MAARKKKVKSEAEPTEMEGKSQLPGHKVAETHLKDHAEKEEPGGDGDDNTPEGTAHAGAVTGGAIGQAVGLPKPLTAAEARDAGMATEAQEKELDAKEAAAAEGSEGSEAHEGAEHED